MKKHIIQKFMIGLLVIVMVGNSMPMVAQTVSSNESKEIKSLENQMEDEDDVFDPVEEKDENGEYKLLDSGCENGLLYNIYQQEGENGDKYACITGYSEDIGSDISVPTHIKGAPVTQLEEGAFNKCENLKSITVPEGVTRIEKELFYNCSNLENVKLPESISFIGYYAFGECTNLTSVNIPENVKEMDQGVFFACKSLKNIQLPTNLKCIPIRTFLACKNLEEIAIPESVVEIGMCAFYNCDKIKKIIIPQNVKIINEDAFGDCNLVEEISVSEENPVYDSRGNCNAIIETETNSLVRGCKNTVIPEDISSIGFYAFNGCDGLTSIFIPKGVTFISPIVDCPDLESIKVAEDNPIYDSRNNCNAIIKTDTGRMVVGCKNTIVPDGITQIGGSAFEGCRDIEGIILPSSVTSIGMYAFTGCTKLQSITISKNIQTIETYAFLRCVNLKDIYYGGSPSQWETLVAKGDIFYYYDEANEYRDIPYTLHCETQEEPPTLMPSIVPSTAPSAAPSTKPSVAPMTSAQPSVAPTKVPTVQPSATPSISPAALAGTVLKEESGRAYKVTEVSDGNSKPKVTITAFSKKDKKAKKVTIPKTVTIDKVTYEVTEVAPKAFKNSKKLENVVIPDTITILGDSSFEGCKKLKSITIGKNMTTIGKNAFKNCKNLKKITIKSIKLEMIGKSALSGIDKKCVIKVPGKQLKTYKKLFKGKGQKGSVKITK